MARLLIVSRSMALAMRLADQHQVTEHPADEADVLRPGPETDVLVLDIGDPIRAVTIVNDLREAGYPVPVLLVSGYQPEWEQVEAQEVEGVKVVPLPITRAALLDGVSALLDEAPDEPSGQLDAIVRTGMAARPPAAVDEDVDDEPDQESQAADTDVDDSEDAEIDARATDADDTEYEDSSGPADPDEVSDGAGRDARADLDTDIDTAGEPGEIDEDLTYGDDAGDADDVEDIADPAADADIDEITRVEAEPAPSGPELTGLTGLTGLTEPDPTERVFTEQAAQQPVRSEPTAPPWEEVLAPAARQAPRWGRFSRGTASPEEAAPDYPTGPPSGSIDTSSYNTGSLTTTPSSNPGTGALNTGSIGRPGLGDRPRKFQRHASTPSFPATQPRTPGSGLVTDPLGPRTDPRGFPSSGLERRLDDDAGALLESATLRDANGVAFRTADLVQVLIDAVPHLYGVGDTAQVLADDVIEKADADAAAVLVPDGPLWRVSGGVGLRPLERRLILDEDHWLISEIGAGGRAVLIDDTDIVRQQLSGAPLAAWRHLLAVPVPDVHAIVVLARGQEAGPFSDRDLSVVFAPVREAAPLLAQAVETRRLARLLGPLREQDPEVVRRTQDS